MLHRPVESARLKRVFGIETRPACGGAVRFIACIQDPEVMRSIVPPG